MRDALRRRSASAMDVPDSAPSQGAGGTGRVLSLARGTLFVDEGVFDGPSGAVHLTAQQRALVAALADGEWRSAAQLERALYARPGDPSRLQSALARLRRALGGGLESAYGGGWRLRSVGPRRPAPTLLDLLSHAEPVPASALQALLGVSNGVLRARIHRLRASGVSIVHEGDGYRLAGDSESPRQALLDALVAHRVVNLWGPLGVGKSELLREVGGTGVRSFAGLSGERLERRLVALAEQGPTTLFLDQVDDPVAAWSGLQALARAGHRAVVATRAPVEGLPQVAYLPWSSDRLRRHFPGRDTSDWDGLPLGACDDARILARLARDPALDEAARALGALDAVAFGPEALGNLRARGVLLGDTSARLAGPVCRALRSGWSDDAWRDLTDRFCDQVLTWTQRRQVEDRRPEIARTGHALMSVLETRGLPRDRLVLALFDAGVVRDEGLLARAVIEARSADLRAILRYRLWLISHADDVHLLEAAIAEASEPLANELTVELAYHLWRTDRAASRAWFDRVGRWLDTQPPAAHLWIRNEWLVSRALRDPGAVTLDALRAQWLALEAASFADGPAGVVPRLEWMKIQIRWAVGRCAMSRDLLQTAVQALEEVVARLGADSVMRGGIDLLLAYTRLEDWDAAERHWELIHAAPLSPKWDGDRRSAFALLRLAQGRLPDAREAVRSLDPSRDWFVPALLAALDGREHPPGIGLRPVLEAVGRAARTGTAQDLQAVRDLPTARYFSGPMLARIVTACVVRPGGRG